MQQSGHLGKIYKIYNDINVQIGVIQELSLNVKLNK